MKAVDTNVIIRLIVNDDERQSEKAEDLFNQNNIFIAKTVLLETEWVLRHAYNFTPSQILTSLKKLLGLPNVIVEDPAVILIAIEWFAHGTDFADALHVASNNKRGTFMTFDQRLAKKMSRLSASKVELLR